VHTRTIERRYFPSGTSILQCITLNDNQDEECWRINYGEVGFQVIDGTSAPVYLSNDCQSWWNGMECTCAVCGYDERGEPMIRGDCSQPSAVQNSVFDWCTATFSGVFADYADYSNGFDEGVAPLGQAGSSAGADLSASVTSAVDFNVGLVMLVVYTVLLAI
jgi:GTP-dependent phosphoenolpyruvate carboxykinase